MFSNSCVDFNSSRQYDYHKSTEENYKSETPSFVGKYKDERKSLDYSYHSYYSPERQLFHDELIDSFHVTRVRDSRTNTVCEVPLENWIVFTAGPMGAGKSHTINWLNAQNIFPLDAFVKVDPDQIRELLPEVAGYNSLDPSLTGYRTQREVGYISEVLTTIALQKGKNVIVDSTMRDADWFAQYFDCLHIKFPHLKIAILSIQARRESIFARALKRAKITGRVVPEQVILDALDRVPRTVENLRPHVDFYAEIRNEDEGEPFVIECEQNRRLRLLSCETDLNHQSFWHMQRIDSKDNAAEMGRYRQIVRTRVDPRTIRPSSSTSSVTFSTTNGHKSDEKEDHKTPDQFVEEVRWKDSWKEDFSNVWVMECALPSTPCSTARGSRKGIDIDDSDVSAVFNCPMEESSSRKTW